MATLQVYTFSQIVTNIATAVQGAAATALNFAVGSVLRAIAQATAGVRALASGDHPAGADAYARRHQPGSDLDSWMADYGVTRLPATSATGQVTFSRFTSTLAALIPVGASVQTADGTQQFTVTADPTNSAYSAVQGGYVVAANTASVSVPVQAANPGSGGNVQAGTITTLTSPVPGIDTVTNASAFTNGIDAEADAALRARFVLYLASLSKATKTAVAYAVASVQQGLSFTVTENQDYSGTADMGYFYVVVDDGTGYPSGGLVSAVSGAIDAVRALTVRFGVFSPAVETANVSLQITTAAGYDHTAAVASVGTALRNFLNGLTLGTGLPYTQIASVAYGIAGVTNVTAVLLNGATADLSATPKQKINAGTITVS